VAHLGLADPVDPAEALLESIGVPRQVVVDNEMGHLKVHTFTGSIGGNQDHAVLVLGEHLLDAPPFVSAHTAVDDYSASRRPRNVRSFSPR
jgi:hypothetical protein